MKLLIPMGRNRNSSLNGLSLALNLFNKKQKVGKFSLKGGVVERPLKEDFTRSGKSSAPPPLPLKHPHIRLHNGS